MVIMKNTDVKIFNGWVGIRFIKSRKVGWCSLSAYSFTAWTLQLDDFNGICFFTYILWRIYAKTAMIKLETFSTTDIAIRHCPELVPSMSDHYNLCLKDQSWYYVPSSFSVVQVSFSKKCAQCDQILIACDTKLYV